VVATAFQHFSQTPGVTGVTRLSGVAIALQTASYGPEEWLKSSAGDVNDKVLDRHEKPFI
jgi:hypothetical protein